MKNIEIIIAFLLVLAFVGCKDTESVKKTVETSGDDGMLSLLSTSWSGTLSADATVYLQHIGKRMSAEEYQFNGYFYNGTVAQNCSNRIDVGSVKVGSKTLTKKNVASGCVNYELDITDRLSDQSSFFGSLVNVSVLGAAGTGFSTGNCDFYNTEKVTISSTLPIGSIPGFPTMELISKGSGYTVTWNPDANNPSGEAVILMRYSKKLTEQIDSNLSLTSFTNHVIVPDNGSYTISTQDLSVFPVNAYIELYVGRGNFKQWDLNGKIVDLISISSDNQDFVLTP